MIGLPRLPEGASALGPREFGDEVSKQLRQLQEQFNSKKITASQYSDAVRRLSTVRSMGQDPSAIAQAIAGLREGSSSVVKTTANRFLIPADGRQPTIFPEGYDQSLSKDMSADVGAWDAKRGR